MWWDALIEFLDRILILLGVKTLVDQNNEIESLENKLKVRDEVKSIKEANDKLNRDALVNELLRGDELPKSF